MKKKNQQRVHFITYSAVIAALYFVLTMAVFPIASGAIQIRISEALCVLAYFTPAAVPGLTIGCFLSNLILTGSPLDYVFGTLATFIGALGGYYLRKNKWLITLPTVLANTIIIPFVIYFGFGETSWALPVVAIFIFVGEFISATILGTGLLKILKKYNFKLK